MEQKTSGIKINPVNSGIIKGIGYDSGVMNVEFKTGHIYEYLDITQKEYESIINAESIGSVLKRTVLGKPVEKLIKKI